MCQGSGISSCFFLSTVIILTVQPDFFNVRGKLISGRLAHSICAQNDQFKQTNVIQPVKLKASSQAQKLPCGWFSLCKSGDSSCTSRQKKFLTCDQVNKLKQQGGKRGRTAKANVKIRGKSTSSPIRGKNRDFNYDEFNMKNLELYNSFNPYFTENKLVRRGSRRKGQEQGEGEAKSVGDPFTPLPLAVAPQHYDLFVRPVVQSNTEWPWTYRTCPGTVKILLDVKEATKRISLHRGATMTINSVTLTETSTNETIQIVNQPFDEADEIQHFDLEKSLDSVEDGAYELFINFTAPIFNDSLLGFYEGLEKDDEGNIKKFWMTQFEFDSTRLMFPSFDEPQFKSTYSISIARTAELNSKSNSPQLEIIEDPEYPGWYVDVFEKTKVKMACYVVAIFLSEFTCGSGPDGVYDKPVQVCASPHLVDKGLTAFPANASAYMMKFLEREYKFPFEMPKVDSVAMNNQYFDTSGMENWGLVFYGELSILEIGSVRSEGKKQYQLRLIAHELAHQWFGNLLTCKNWENLWLNEGLTTFASRIFSQVNPEFDSPGPSDTRNIQAADLGNVKPVAGPGAGDGSITYTKGASLITMFEPVLGKDVMNQALVEYIRRNAYGSVVQDDLSEVLTEFGQKHKRLPQGKTMKDILDTWTYIKGHPLIRIKVEEGSSGDETDTKTVSLTQERFSSLKSKENRADSEKPFWEIPIYMISHKNPDIGDRTPDMWLSDSNASVTITTEPGSWYNFNGNGIGYYRVLYDDQLFDLLLTQLEKDHTAIAPLARDKLIDDYKVFLQQGHIDAVTCLKLTKYLLAETDRVVWQPVSRGLLELFLQPRLISRDEYKGYWTPRIDNLLKFLDMDKQNERGSAALFKAQILGNAAMLNIPSFMSKASALVEKWKSSGASESPIQVDYHKGIYCGAIAGSDNSHFDFLLNKYMENPKKSQTFLIALFCSTNPTNIRRALNVTLNPSIFDSVQLAYTLSELTARPTNRDPVLEFLDEQFQEIVKIHDMVAILLAVGYLNDNCYDVSDRDKMLEFLEKHRGDLGKSTDELIENTKKKYDDNIKWMDQVGRAALTWMAQNT